MHTSFLSLSLSLFSRPPSMHKHNTTHDCCVRREIKNLLSLAFGDLYNRQCLPLFSLSLYLLYTVASLSLSLSINSASQHSFPKGITFSLSLFQHLLEDLHELSHQNLCTTRQIILYMLCFSLVALFSFVALFLLRCSVLFGCSFSVSLAGHTLNPETMQ